MPQWYRAVEQFSATLDDGITERTVHLGEVFPAGHELVKRDAGRNLLFKPLDNDQPDAPKPRAKAPGKGGS